MPTGFSNFESGCFANLRGFRFESGGCGSCADSTHIGQQNFSWSLWNANTATGGNTRTSWGYIEQDGEAYTMVGQGNCGPFSNMSYSNDPLEGDCCQVNHITDDGATTTKIVPPNLPASPLSSGSASCKIGQSDEPLFDINNGTSDTGAFDNAFIYPVLDLRVEPNFISGSGIFTGAWCKDGEDLYCAQNNAGGQVFVTRFGAYDVTRPANHTLISAQISGVVNMGGICALSTSDYLYFHMRISPNVNKIFRLDRATLTNLTEIINLGDIEMFGIHLKADNTLWMFTQVGSRWVVYYWNGSELIYVGAPGRVVSLTFGNCGIHFIGRRMFIGGCGIGASPTGIYVTELPCDESESLFAEVTAGAASVVRGNQITATWADLLIPNANDRIHVRPAPANAHDTGFIGSATTTALTGGTSDGSINITIPIGTTPGTYIMQLVSQNNVYVCRSATFEVTT